MRPRKLTICGWGPYRGLEEIDFDPFWERGIFLITGATGAGKTTIFDAISYALYGALSGEERDKERNSVRSDFADAQTPTYVELVMEHGGGVYTIKRNPEYLRPKKRGNAQKFTPQKENAVLLFPDGRALEGVREVNSALREILVLDYQQFKKISMIAQGEFAKLLVASPKEKTKIFREIFGTGIYERFTAGLSFRTKQLYNRVKESKSKLEEDLRILTVGIEKGGWNEEAISRLRELTEAPHWNYEELTGCLRDMEEEAAVCLKNARRQYQEADRRTEELTTALTAQREINKKLEQFEQNEKELAKLEDRAEEYREKERIYRAAINAQFLAGLEEKITQIRKGIADNGKALEKVSGEKEKLSGEQKELDSIVERADRVRLLLETAKKRRECQLQYEQQSRLLWQKQQEFEKQQSDYLEKETAYRREKALYEEEEHKRRMTAVGLAASLLEEGCPCPVCGSMEHPHPAQMQEESVSEEQLGHRKKELERMDGKLRKLEGGIAADRALLYSERQKQEALEKDIGELNGILEQETDRVCLFWLEGDPDTAVEKLEKQCVRAKELTVLLKEKEEQENSLREQKKERKAELQQTEQEFEEALKQHGFASAADYGEVKRDRAECDKLQKEISDYQSRRVACMQLREHLKESVQGLESRSLTLLEEMLRDAKEEKKACLKMQQQWEKNRNEVKKTNSLMNANLEQMETESRKYGYVKDLENMATGNNARRLVFEQYVLAGYFEEILKAANLRFATMTSGRYEMRRVEEVGDGRVKDNLEIQVMDYYTGRLRSVRTLSGGESFKASLSLALGMSDVIQAASGGIRVDTLFVDEGFGALDSESLDQACDALMGLVENNHLIGIISHVPQLRERIGSQLIIEKTNSGSVIKNGVY